MVLLVISRRMVEAWFDTRFTFGSAQQRERRSPLRRLSPWKPLSSLQDTSIVRWPRGRWCATSTVSIHLPNRKRFGHTPTRSTSTQHLDGRAVHELQQCLRSVGDVVEVLRSLLMLQLGVQPAGLIYQDVTTIQVLEAARRDAKGTQGA